MANLHGVDQIKVPSSAVLIFSHEAVPQGPLYIHSGANAIKWAYKLNTQSTPTIGGEVVQVLSALVGPMQIGGQTAGIKTNQSGRLGKNEIRGWKKDGTKDNYSPNDELKAIVDWFESYMEVAGSTTRGNQRRDERAVLFTYPERGWTFRIIPTSISGFRYDATVISPEWSITAEIISDNALNFFSGITMSSFNDDVLTNQSLIGQLGLSKFAASGTETDNFAFGQTGDIGSTDPFLNPALGVSAAQAARTMGDNFQALVASWSSGTFSDFGFGALLDNGALPKNVDQVYQDIFGSTFIGRLPGNTGAGTTTPGSAVYGGPTNPVTRDQIVLDIAATFEQKGIAGKLGVAVALTESGINPDARQQGGDFAMGLFQTFPTGAGGTFHKAELTDAINHKDQPVTKFYPVGMQIGDASNWFKAAKGGRDMLNASNEVLAAFGHEAQGAGDPDYTSKVLNNLGKAAQLIASAQNGAANNTGPVPVGSAAALARELLRYAGNKWRDDNGKGLAQIQKVANGEALTSQHGGVKVELDPRTIKTILWLIAKGYTVGTYAWCEDHSDDGLNGHAGGKAVDISSINGVSINQEASHLLTVAVATLLHNPPSAITPAQLITGGFGNHSDSQLRSLTIPSAAFYGETTMAEHCNHIHMGF